MPVGQNTGYLIERKLFFPGDSFTVLSKDIEILALPVEAPWMKVSEAIEYAEMLKPKVCFPIHDAVLSSAGMQIADRIFENILSTLGIKYMTLGKEESIEV
jgi:L-ascorbate metabolism protein UlaG (beta-lactamase superfamily)